MAKLHSIIVTAVLSIIILATASCEKIFENESDCSTKIKFEFRKHRSALQSTNGKGADIFDSAIGSIHLFVYDAESGAPVFEKFEYTRNLKTESDLNIGTGSEKCYMTVDLDPGKYRIVAWCGLDESDQNNAFFLSDENTRAKYAECRVKISEQTGLPTHSGKYESVYHGSVAEAVINAYGTTVPLELTKDNNDISVWVQHTSALFSQGDYEVVYTDSNGTMKFDDNSLTNNDVLEYHPYATSLLTASAEYNGSVVEAGALVAHISTSRLMEAHKNDARLEVRDKEGKILFSIPFIKYILEMQTFTSDGQYYLDCEDTYNCSFYLSGGGEGGETPPDEDGMWTPSCIIINNWVRVPDQTGGIGGE